MLALMVVLALVSQLVFWEYIHNHPTGVLAYMLAVLPALSFIGIMVTYGLYIAELKDEFVRTVVKTSLLWSIVATLSVTTLWGFLELLANAPHLQPLLVLPIFGIFLGITTALVNRRYE
jgi:CDP-diglyceride synthetase